MKRYLAKAGVELQLIHNNGLVANLYQRLEEVILQSTEILQEYLGPYQ